MHADVGSSCRYSRCVVITECTLRLILLWSSEPYVHLHLEIAVERARLESAWRSGFMQSDSMI